MREQLEDILWRKTVDDVKKHAKKLGVKTSGIKGDIINNIIDFYCQENWVINNYKAMSVEEKEFMDNIIRQKFNPTSESIREIHDKFDNLDLTRVDYYYIDRYDGEYIPKCFRDILENLVEPYEISFECFNGEIEFEKSYGNIIGGEVHIDYINKFISFINQNKIKSTEKNHLFPKSAFIKFTDETGVKEVSRDLHKDYINIKNVSNTVVFFGMISLLKAAYVIETKDNYGFSIYYEDYIKMNKVDQAKFLLEKYLSAHTIYINEIERIMGEKYYMNYGPNLYDARNFILGAIKKMPVNKWITDTELIKNIRMSDYNFLRKCTGEILRDYGKYWDECGFYGLESHFIDICLMEYFAVLGIVDVVIGVKQDFYTQKGFLYVKYLRLTEFGSMVLGLSQNSFIEETIPLIVNEKFQIIVSDDSKKMRHELYFDRFFDKTIIDDKIVYDITFDGFVKAYKIGVGVSDILLYLEKECSDIPCCVWEKLIDYCEIQDKIRIKTVKVIEFSDEFKDSIINNKKIMKMCDKSLENIVAVNDKKINEIKKELEKQGLFCSVEE